MPDLILGPTRENAPSQYTLAPRQAIIPESVTATFDGSGAAGAFLPTISVYSQDGVLIARCPATQVSAGSSAEVTFAPLLRAATSAVTPSTSANLAYAVASVTSASIPIGVPGTFTFPDLTSFDTNDSVTYAHDSTGGGGHSGGIFIQAAGRYLTLVRAQYRDPAGAPVEPAASQMYCTWDSYNYNGSESDFVINQTIATGFPGFPNAPWGTTLTWTPWNLDQQDIGAGFVGPPFSEYHAALYNGSTTQAMAADVSVMVLRIGDSDGL
jgi:hypothetical protein